MSVQTKKRLILQNLLHLDSGVDTKQQRANSGVCVQVTADLWPVTPRPRTRGTGAALPFQKRVQRAIGHIAGVRTNHLTTGPRERSRVIASVYATEAPQRVTLRYRR